MKRAWNSWVFALVVSSQASASERETPSLGDVIAAMAGGAYIGVIRDSGQPVTLEFLESCRKNIAPHYTQLKCDDLVPTWHISRVANTKDRDVFAITAEGASSEGRWVLEYENNSFREITRNAWPEISRDWISIRMISATGDYKYSADYLLRVAHSSYRVQHPSESDGPITVHTGVPDETYGTWIGELRWEDGELRLE